MPTIETTRDLHLDAVTLKKAALVYRAINHPLRQQMLRVMHINLRMAVTEMYVKLRLEQSVTSQHLAILRGAGLVNTQRDGKRIFYSVNYQRLKELHLRAEELFHLPLL